MNMIDALKEQEKNPKKWARPVSWKGVVAGFVVDRGKVKYVPSSRGAIEISFPSMKVISDEWEVVDTDIIYKEEEKDNSDGF